MVMMSAQFRESVKRWWRENNPPEGTNVPPRAPLSKAEQRELVMRNAEAERVRLLALIAPDRDADLTPLIVAYQHEGKRQWQCMGRGKHCHLTGSGDNASKALLTYLYKKAAYVARYGPY